MRPPFNANPLGAAVGLEVMKLCAEGGYATSVPEKGAYFLDGPRELQKRWPEIGDVDGLGLALRCEITQSDGFTPTSRCSTAWRRRRSRATCSSRAGA